MTALLAGVFALLALTPLRAMLSAFPTAREGMSLGAATAFMVTGPATKITNLGALKIVLGAKNFALYLAFVLLFSLVTGAVVNIFPF